ncbi:helix-turn-helix transcriptional regulator [Paenibacillus sp. TRM 82003]|nr:helix-turn-helix transcriptional regulator [Paenibacillus sp. TRM 82003]
MKQVKISINKDYITSEMKRRKIASINELAREIGLSESMLHLILNDKRNPGPKVIGLMLSYFGCNFEKIFRETLTNVHKTA